MKDAKERLIDGILATLLLIAAVAVIFYFSVPMGILFSAFVVIYVALLYARTKGARIHFYRYKSKGTNPLITKLVRAIDLPVVIVDDNNKIVWANKLFSSLPGMEESLLLPSPNSIMNGAFSYSNLDSKYSAKQFPFDVTIGESSFNVGILQMELGSKTFYGAVLHDNSEEKRLSQQLHDRNVMIAVASIDNASELVQNGNESYRLTSAKISVELTAWVKEFDGLITEFENGSYLMIFDRAHLNKMEEAGFDIVERITDLSAEDASIPLTISIGVSDETGSVAEKYLSAQNALRIAFQKGGAVAIVKTPKGYNSYGGKTKSAQKETSVWSRVRSEQLVANILSSSNVLIMGHLRPDFDSIASNVGISKLVSKLGKPVKIVTDVTEGNIANAFAMLEGIPEYDNMFIDVIAGMNLMTSETLLIITDASNPDNFYSKDLFENAQRVFIIDHHTYGEDYKDSVLLPTANDPHASSASELVCEMMEVTFPENILRAEEAQLMLTGILLDTQFFSRDTGSRTFRACAFLRSAGADSAKVKMLFKSDFDEFERTNLFLAHRQVFQNSFMIAYYGGDTDPQNMVCAAKAAEQLVNISGIIASFVLYMTDDGVCLSARSDGTFNVINVVQPLGGGGHFQSAGARLVFEGAPVMDMAHAVEIVKQSIMNCLETSSKVKISSDI